MFRVSGKNIEAGEALRERVGARVQDVVAKKLKDHHSDHRTGGVP